MINIISIRCSVAFAPYLFEGLQSYLQGAVDISQVVRQGASGLIIRAAANLSIRHQGREVILADEEYESAQHFFSTIHLRSEFYDVARRSDEVVLASVGPQLLLSHPQSEIWLPAEALPVLIDAFHKPSELNQAGLPDWLTLSGGDGRLLLSDQRSGRWVLLGADHLAEFERRREPIRSGSLLTAPIKPPTVSVKGVTVHYQSAFKLAEALEVFAQTNTFQPFEEMTPQYCLGVARTSEGMQIVDSNLKTAITAREARKWAAILRDELEKRQARQLERGAIRTVFADGEDGRWVLQWGDEICLSPQEQKALASTTEPHETEKLVFNKEGQYHLALEKASGNCIALTEKEVEMV
jgi:hypothetical protein